jgi:hypothetical protein
MADATNGPTADAPAVAPMVSALLRVNLDGAELRREGVMGLGHVFCSSRSSG